MRRFTSVVRAVTALAVIALLVVGVPLFLWRAVGVPFPTSLLSTDLEIVLRSGLGRDLFPKVLALIGWIVWAQLAWAFAVELVAAVRGRSARALPVLPGLQRTASNLITSVALLAQTFGSPVAAMAAPPELRPITAVESSAVIESVERVAEAPVFERVTITVEEGDSWWRIAERNLGSGLRWKEVREANLGRVMPSGHVITDRSDGVDVGWQIMLPAGAVAATSGDAFDSPDALDPLDALLGGDSRIVEVEPGDSLWLIAEEDLAERGEPDDVPTVTAHWAEIIELNDHFEDPDLIHPGDEVVLPALDEPAAPTAEMVPEPPTELEPDLEPVEVDLEPEPATDISPWDTALASADTPPPDADLEPATALVDLEADPLVAGDAWWLVLALAGFASPVVSHLRRRRVEPDTDPEPSFGAYVSAAFLADAEPNAAVLAVVTGPNGDLVIATGCRQVPGWIMRRPGVFEVPPGTVARGERFAPQWLVDCGDLPQGGRLWVDLAAAPVISLGGADPNIDEVMARLAGQFAAGRAWWIGPDCPEGLTARSVAEFEASATFGAETARPLVFAARGLDIDSRARISAHLDWAAGAVVGWIPTPGRDLWRWYALDDGRLRLALPGAPLAWTMPDARLTAS
jgi:hypothetical protein